MATEIERKFLLKNSSWKELADEGTQYSQGYLLGSQFASVRVRIQGKRAFLNIKSATIDITRQEFEYEIPLDDATEMLETLCEKPLIEKNRYILKMGKHAWEIDVFSGDNEGLIVAEIELSDQNEHFDKPDWLGAEVSDDARYYNVNLVKHPFKDWS
ncbi:MAG: CYTH domain-containing protein [Gammaproteobacteria bacterium]|nr:CYTH domain-containing protein [Gammaproteobacteria bacterium]MCW9031367.1 CYTH domain-containing protein [Gammaproteobacteria bacterium]